MRFKQEKAVQVINFFVEREGGIANYMKVIKLIVLADRLHLLMYGRLITNDVYYALKNGPIPSHSLDIAKVNSEEYNISTLGKFDRSLVSESDVSVMEEVYQRFGRHDQHELADITHLLPEWKRYKTYFDEGNTGRKDIVMEDMFEKPDELDMFNIDDEIIRLTKELYFE